MVKAGVIDPAKVTRSALQNAASIAALVLTTEASVVEKPEDEDEAAAAAAATATCTELVRYARVPPRGRGAKRPALRADRVRPASGREYRT